MESTTTTPTTCTCCGSRTTRLALRIVRDSWRHDQPLGELQARMETVLKEVFRDGIEVGEKGIIAQIEATPGNA